MDRLLRKLCLVVLFVVFAGRAAAAPPSDVECSVTAPNVTCVMNHLDQPRGLAFGPHGTLFVAEAGYGKGTTPCAPNTGFNCYGHTGAISRLWKGEQVRVSTGLPSLAFVLGASARGPHDILMWTGKVTQPSVLGEEGALVTIGLEMTATARNAAGRGDMGRLVHIPMDALLAPSSQLCPTCWTSVVDVAAFNTQESDPYALQLDEGRGSDDDAIVMVDSSRDGLLRIDAEGNISPMATFPTRVVPSGTGTRTVNPVPTTIVRGPDGDYYVGELVGVPFQSSTTPAFTRPSANVYRVSADPPYEVSVLVGGFNAIIDIAFHGEDLYVLQHWSSFASPSLKDGKLLRIACHDRPLVCDGAPEEIIGGLDGPTSVLVGRGSIYITNHGAAPAFTSQNPATLQHLGEVLRIALDDDEAAEED